MPVGLFNSLAGQPNQPGQHPTSHQVVNDSFRLVLAATGVAQLVPSLRVPPNCTVNIRGHNGTGAGNSATITVGPYKESLGGPSSYPITPDTEIWYPASDIGRIWVVGTAGDGVIVSVRQNG